MALSTLLFTDVHSGLGYDPVIQEWRFAQPDESSADHPPVEPAAPTEWHIPEGLSSPSNLLYPSSPSSSGSSSSSRASSPIFSAASSPSRPVKKPSVSRRRAKDPNHIPRPRNSFIIFRSHACPHIKAVESDHRMISRIVGDMWKKAPPAVKDVYQQLAVLEKQQHSFHHPNYKFAPQARATPPKKRNVKRNGESDKQRCIRVAELLLKGKGGDELKAEVSKFDEAVQEKTRQNSAEDFSTGVFDSTTWASPPTPPPESPSTDSSTSNETAFRSPLLPPATPELLSALSIPVTTPSEPLSPLDLLPTNETQTPSLNIIPLPELPEDSSLLLNQHADYSCVQVALDPSTPFGAMQAHEHGSLALSHMYSPKTAPFIMAAHNEDYTFQAEPFVHDISVPIDPTLQTFSFSAPAMEVSQMYSQFAYDSHYALVDVDSASHTQSQMQMQIPRSAEWVFPSGDMDMDMSLFQPFAVSMPGQEEYAQNAWSYTTEGPLAMDVSSQAQNMSAHAWMQ